MSLVQVTQSIVVLVSSQAPKLYLRDRVKVLREQQINTEDGRPAARFIAHPPEQVLLCLDPRSRLIPTQGSHHAPFTRNKTSMLTYYEGHRLLHFPPFPVSTPPLAAPPRRLPQSLHPLQPLLLDLPHPSRLPRHLARPQRMVQCHGSGPW